MPCNYACLQKSLQSRCFRLKAQAGHHERCEVDPVSSVSASAMQTRVIKNLNKAHTHMEDIVVPDMLPANLLIAACIYRQETGKLTTLRGISASG